MEFRYISIFKQDFPYTISLLVEPLNHPRAKKSFSHAKVYQVGCPLAIIWVSSQWTLDITTINYLFFWLLRRFSSGHLLRSEKKIRVSRNLYIHTALRWRRRRRHSHCGRASSKECQGCQPHRKKAGVIIWHNPTLRIQICPKEGISPIFLFWGWDWDHQTYSREGYGSLGPNNALLYEKRAPIF